MALGAEQSAKDAISRIEQSLDGNSKATDEELIARLSEPQPVQRQLEQAIARGVKEERARIAFDPSIHRDPPPQLYVSRQVAENWIIENGYPGQSWPYIDPHSGEAGTITIHDYDQGNLKCRRYEVHQELMTERKFLYEGTVCR